MADNVNRIGFIPKEKPPCIYPKNPNLNGQVTKDTADNQIVQKEEPPCIYPKNPNLDGQVTKDTAQTPQTPGTPVKPGDVLDYLAQNAAVKIQPRAYDISKYVTPEQAARIAGFVTGFENEVTNALAAISLELGDSLSKPAKLELAAKIAEAKN